MKILEFRNSVLQDGGRNFAITGFRPPGRRTEIESSVLKLRPPGRRTEIEDGGQDGARFPDPRTEDGPVLRFRPPGRRTEIEDGGQDGGRFPDPRTEDGAGGDSVLCPPGRSYSFILSSSARKSPPPIPVGCMQYHSLVERNRTPFF